MRRLWDLFWDGKSLSHSLSRGNVQKHAFLFDAAALLLAVSMLHENDERWLEPLEALTKYLESFRDGESWVESRAADFRPVAASRFDHPIPSSAALAEMDIAREALRAWENPSSRALSTAGRSRFREHRGPDAERAVPRDHREKAHSLGRSPAEHDARPRRSRKRLLQGDVPDDQGPRPIKHTESALPAPARQRLAFPRPSRATKEPGSGGYA